MFSAMDIIINARSVPNSGKFVIVLYQDVYTYMNNIVESGQSHKIRILVYRGQPKPTQKLKKSNEFTLVYNSGS